MIYHDPNDPERGYITWDDLMEMSWEEFYATRFEPAPCSVCGGEIPEDATLPLCLPCEGTARATAKAFPDGPEATFSPEARERARRLK